MTAEGREGAADRAARRLVKAGLVHLSLALPVGGAMLLFGNDNLRFLHSHLALGGGVLFLAWGAGLALLPGRLGDPSRLGGGLAHLQFWAAVAGLWGMLLGSLLPVGFGLDRLAVPFGFLFAAAGLLYAFVLWRAIG